MVKLQTDPATQQAAFHTATQLMQPMAHGQTQMGHIGRALGSGQMYLQMMNQNASEGARKDKEVQSQEELRTAQTGQVLQETQQKGDLFPQTQAKLNQDLANARTEGEIKTAKLALERFNADPKTMAANLKLDQDKVRAQTGAANASAAQAYAGAEEHRAGTAAKKVKTVAEQTAWDAMTPDEQKAAGTQALTGAKTAKQTLQENMDAFGLMFKKSTAGQKQAGETDATYEQRVADFSISAVKKVQSDPKLTAAYKVMENFDASPEDRSVAAAYISKALTEGAAPAAKPAAGDTAAWTKARNSVKVGGTYTGPDGQQYVRNK
jgi:hypothetical protein